MSRLTCRAAISLLLLPAPFSVVHAHGGDTSLIHACIDASQVMKLSAADQECPAGETPLHWAIQGPPGPTDPVLLGRIDTLEAQVATLQSQVQSLIEPELPDLLISDVTLAEGTGGGGTSFDFTVSLSMPSADTVIVDYNTANGSADETDFASASGQLVFQPGETSKLVSVAVTPDAHVESDEDFFLYPNGVVNANSAGVFGTATIVNDDLASLSIAGPAALQEGNLATYTVTMAQPAMTTVSVDYGVADGTATLADNDYADTAGTLVFNPGETSKEFSVQTTDDGVSEGVENFTAVLSNPVNAVLATSQVATDIFDASVSVSIQDASVIEGNNGGSAWGWDGWTVMSMNIVLPQPLTSEVTVRWGPIAGGTATPYSYGGGDFRIAIPFSNCNADSAPSSCPSVTLLPGETVKTIKIMVYGDKTAEPDENFFIKIFDVAGAAVGDDTAEGVIINDD